VSYATPQHYTDTTDAIDPPELLPQFFTRSGEEIELPSGFNEAVKAVTSGVTCVNCSHPHYSRLVAPPRETEGEAPNALQEIVEDDGLKQLPESAAGILLDVTSPLQ
jgi:hypothetical protein